MDSPEAQRQLAERDLVAELLRSRLIGPTDGAGLPRAMDAAADGVADAWQEAATGRVEADRAEREEFLRSHRPWWGEALDCFHHLVLRATDLGADLVEDRPAEGEDMLFEVTGTLHARACSTGQAVAVLLDGGFPEDAGGRARTLHELSVVAAVLGRYGREEGSPLVERYVEHGRLADLRYAEDLGEHHERLGVDPPATAYLDRLRAYRDEVRIRYGGAFLKDYGWAVSLCPDPTFQALEAKVGLDHLRPVYRLNSAPIHGGVTGTSAYLADRAGEQVRLSAATSHGLGLPAVVAAASLAQITWTFAAFGRAEPNPGYLGSALGER